MSQLPRCATYEHLSGSAPHLGRSGWFMSIIGFHHAAISTANLERLVAFYRDCFGFEPVFEFSSPTPKPQDLDRPVIDHGFTHICVAVDDAGAECTRLEALGVRLHCPVIQSDLPAVGTYGRDPDGNVFEILEVRDPQHPLDFANRRLEALKEKVRIGACA
jgi:catechol 2,3-dioxygenase-like lactoylglutathione lyase family enzyme